ncbi:TPA: hypothetical protein ACQUHZ_000268 [Neisseria cinerea]
MPSERSDGIFLSPQYQQDNDIPNPPPQLDKHSHPFKQNLQTKRYTVSYPPY